MVAVLDCDNRTFDELQGSAGVKDIVAGCLRRDPEARWQAAHDLRMVLPFAVVMETATPRAPWRQAIPWIAIAVVAVAAVLAFALRPKAPVPEELRTLTLPAPENTNSIKAAAISPDGRFAAMVADGRLWIRPLASMTARPVDESTEVRTPFWAPDGSAVGFFAGGKLKRVAPTGGIPETLAAAPGETAEHGPRMVSSYTRHRETRVCTAFQQAAERRRN